MFLPFLLSLASFVSIIYCKRSRTTTYFFIAALISTLFSFAHHATDSLNLYL
ncbi:DUF5993 family protein [Burkholderia sp. AU30280]|uniref:DUF5993 family protein n=1 Tax=Burkholderia sp. AU30280 TaxID=2879628 RepID=UPI001CF0F618|nr:DUF5993 family protein [Burkholderia sp. AU30280]